MVRLTRESKMQVAERTDLAQEIYESKWFTYYPCQLTCLPQQRRIAQVFAGIMAVTYYTS